MSVEVEQETFTLEEILAATNGSNKLILWNDDINTFDHVIHCLMHYLQYDEEEAARIAWTVHTKGKCIILEGSYTEVEVYRKILKTEGLSVSVE
ncbi:ATP-dependent Clp protease adaptor ClpS [Sphingobacterium lactis]|uniref:ATP-dependent Clp protease adaptor ClpS n=1 Tax=Sphingobacterium lactis TaxID=797291 RepID=UPI003DA5934D